MSPQGNVATQSKFLVLWFVSINFGRKEMTYDRKSVKTIIFHFNWFTSSIYRQFCSYCFLLFIYINKNVFEFRILDSGCQLKFNCLVIKCSSWFLFFLLLLLFSRHDLYYNCVYNLIYNCVSKSTAVPYANQVKIDNPNPVAPDFDIFILFHSNFFVSFIIFDFFPLCRAYET